MALTSSAVPANPSSFPLRLFQRKNSHDNESEARLAHAMSERCCLPANALSTEEALFFTTRHNIMKKNQRRSVLRCIITIGIIFFLFIALIILYLVAGSPKIAWIKVGAVTQIDGDLTMQFWVWTSPDVYVSLREVHAGDQGDTVVSHSGSVSTNQPANAGVILWPWQRYGLGFDWSWMKQPFIRLRAHQIIDRLEIGEGKGYWLRGSEYLRIIEEDGKVLVLSLQELPK